MKKSILIFLLLVNPVLITAQDTEFYLWIRGGFGYNIPISEEKFFALAASASLNVELDKNVFSFNHLGGKELTLFGGYASYFKSWQFMYGRSFYFDMKNCLFNPAVIFSKDNSLVIITLKGGISYEDFHLWNSVENYTIHGTVGIPLELEYRSGTRFFAMGYSGYLNLNKVNSYFGLQLNIFIILFSPDNKPKDTWDDY
jgi:hypothetical protein